MWQQCYYRIYTYVSRSHLLTQTWQTNDNGTDNDNYCQDCSLTIRIYPQTLLTVHRHPDPTSIHPDQKDGIVAKRSDSQWLVTSLDCRFIPHPNPIPTTITYPSPPLCLKAPPSLRTQFKSLSLLANKGIIYFRRVHLSVTSENHKSTFLTLADFYVLPKR